MAITNKLKKKLEEAGSDMSGQHTIVDMLKRKISESGGDTSGIQNIEDAIMYLDFSGGSPTPVVNDADVYFYDYDGTVVYSYTKTEFLALSSMPANPSHEGLTAQGWNWTLSDAKEHVQNNGKLIIGQMYITDDGKTRLYIHLPEDGDNHAAISLGCTEFGGVSIHWGDSNAPETSVDMETPGTYDHWYAAAGDYVITLTVTNGEMIWDNPNESTMMIMGDYTDSPTDIVSKIEIGSGVTIIGSGWLGNCPKLKYVTIPESIISINSSAFKADRSLLSCVTIPPGHTIIYGDTFADAHLMPAVAIPNGLETIEEYAFRRACRLSTLTLPSSVTTIERQAFSECRALSYIKIPSGITQINIGTFEQCTALGIITVPSGITEINNNAFTQCYCMTEIHVEATTPPTLGSGVFEHYVPIYVPQGTLSAYQAANSWHDYIDQLVEEE